MPFNFSLDFCFGDFVPVEGIVFNPHFGDFWPLTPDDNMLLIFRGENRLQDIDYTEIVAARLGSGDVTIDSPPHVLETNYYYAARQVSIYGRLEHNMTVVEKFRLASDGEPEADRPDHITALTAEAVAAGKIKLVWSHRKINGTSPVKFNVYYDNGAGAGAAGDTELSEVDYRGDGSYVYTTAALTDGTRYHFAVTAEDAVGSEDRFNRVVSAVADSSVPEALTGITTEVVF